MRASCGLLLAFFAVPAVLFGSDPGQRVLSITSDAIAAPACADGVKLDDGVFEGGYRIPFAASAQFVQRLTPPSYPALLRQACSCWKRAPTGAGMVRYSVVVYDDNGPGGQPGTRLGTLSSSAGVTLSGTFSDVDCIPLDIKVTEGSVYVGVDWNAAGTLGVFVCADESPTTPRATMYESASGGSTWSPVTAVGQALGIRAEFEADASACVPSSTQLCLNQGRFAVTAKFKAGTNPEGTSNVAKLTDETGYLWFFNSANVEAVVKVLDACALNKHFWVFAGGLTDVQVDLTVTDTETGESKTYSNPQGKPFQPIQDTVALPCD